MDVVEQAWQGQNFRYKAVALLIQAVNHGVEHCTNIRMILAQQHIRPPDIEGWGYGNI